MSVVIGIDPHKASHHAFAVDEREVELAELSVRSTRTQVERLLSWAEVTVLRACRTAVQPASTDLRGWLVCGDLDFDVLCGAVAEHECQRERVALGERCDEFVQDDLFADLCCVLRIFGRAVEMPDVAIGRSVILDDRTDRC